MIERVESSQRGYTTWLCQCSCGARGSGAEFEVTRRGGGVLGASLFARGEGRCKRWKLQVMQIVRTKPGGIAADWIEIPPALKIPAEMPGQFYSSSQTRFARPLPP